MSCARCPPLVRVARDPIRRFLRGPLGDLGDGRRGVAEVAESLRPI